MSVHRTEVGEAAREPGFGHRSSGQCGLPPGAPVEDLQPTHRRLLCTKGRKAFDTVVHKSFQRFIYIVYLLQRVFSSLVHGEQKMVQF